MVTASWCARKKTYGRDEPHLDVRAYLHAGAHPHPHRHQNSHQPTHLDPSITASFTPTATATAGLPDSQAWRFYYYAGADRIAVRVQCTTCLPITWAA